MVITRTPFRISFFGGGTDYPVWYREHGGAVLATTIDKSCYITCRRLPPFFEYHSRIAYSKVENVNHNPASVEWVYNCRSKQPIRCSDRTTRLEKWEALTIAESAVKEFGTSLRGQCSFPISAAMMNPGKSSMIARHPAMIVECAGVADVTSAVGFTRSHNVLLWPFA